MINSRDIKDLTPNAQIKCSELLKACAALNIKMSDNSSSTWLFRGALSTAGTWYWCVG
jgi:hypothetical protein